MNTAGPSETDKPGSAVLSISTLALIVGLLPIVLIHVCYALSVQAGRAPFCIPYLDGCTSISRAARFGLANHLFKAGMLPLSALLALFWLLAASWLRELAPARARRIRAMRVIGVIGALFLVLYASFLGVEGETYQWMRRYGITVYFSFTVLAQMLLSSLLPRGWLRRVLTCLCAAMLLLGLASVPLQHLVADRDATLNALEWTYALFMSTGFALVGLDWRRRGLRLALLGR